MREQYDRQLKKLNEELIRMGEMICEAISGAVGALENRDNSRARQIIAYDEEIDQQERLVETMRFAARLLGAEDEYRHGAHRRPCGRHLRARADA